MSPKVLGVGVGVGDNKDSDEHRGKEYIDSLSELEKKVCDIARDHLKSSFDLLRSSGFLAWKKSNSS